MPTYKRRTILTMQRTLSDVCEHDVKVTRIGDGYNIRVLLNGQINQESRVYDKEDVSREIYQMLRMEDKCGNISEMASASRERYNKKLNKIDNSTRNEQANALSQKPLGLKQDPIVSFEQGDHS